MNKKIIYTIIALIGFTFIFQSCVKQKFENPEEQCNNDLKANISIKQFKNLLAVDTMKITDDIIIEGIVTSTDQYGNFYKELVIQDTSAAISIMLDASYLYTKYPLGQKVFVKCKDLYLGKDGGVVKLGATYTQYNITKFGRIQGEPVIDAHIIKSCTNSPAEPLNITLADINGNIVYRLVKINNVQFKLSEIFSTWADAVNLETVNHHIIDADGNTLIVRTSGYANFARDSLPRGNGSIVGVLSKYNSDWQLFVRNVDDANMKGARFHEALIFKDFEDGDIYSGGWTVYTVNGLSWQLGTIGGSYAQCKNWNGSQNVATESWYISPELNLSLYSEVNLEFKNACNYQGDVLKVKYSTDYNGTGDPNNATWTELNPTLSSGDWNWVNSGALNIPVNTKYVAFVYTGSDNDGKTWEIDNIKIDGTE